VGLHSRFIQSDINCGAISNPRWRSETATTTAMPQGIVATVSAFPCEPSGYVATTVML
jgi:hypothetical protein